MKKYEKPAKLQTIKNQLHYILNLERSEFLFRKHQGSLHTDVENRDTLDLATLFAECSISFCVGGLSKLKQCSSSVPPRWPVIQSISTHQRTRIPQKVWLHIPLSHPSSVSLSDHGYSSEGSVLLPWVMDST